MIQGASVTRGEDSGGGDTVARELAIQNDKALEERIHDSRLSTLRTR